MYMYIVHVCLPLNVLLFLYNRYCDLDVHVCHIDIFSYVLYMYICICILCCTCSLIVFLSLKCTLNLIAFVHVFLFFSLLNFSFTMYTYSLSFLSPLSSNLFFYVSQSSSIGVGRGGQRVLEHPQKFR